MRLWSIHPKYLDSKGLVASWREALLAKKVLEGKTKGYIHHPQLVRFKTCRCPVDEINAYLEQILTESLVRGYNFDGTKIIHVKHPDVQIIPVTDGQADYEFRLLQKKLKERSPDKYTENNKTTTVELNGLFHALPGQVAEWEKVKPV
jgi:hypothetical protein